MTVPVRKSGCLKTDLAPGATFTSDRALHKGELLSIAKFFEDLAEIAPPVPMHKNDLWLQEHFENLIGATIGIAPAVPPEPRED